MKKILSYIIMLGEVIMASSQLSAQTVYNDSLMSRNFSYVKNRDFWLTSTNAAALTQYRSANISAAEMSATHRKGGFINYDESPNTWSIGARAESYYRLSPTVVTYGMMSYDGFLGKSMTGSAFIDTSRQSFDITEDSLTNPGKKHRDTYHLIGAIGWEVRKGLDVGAKIDFTAANAAKYKDLRHKTKLMNLEASAGMFAPIGKSLALGANYTYRRNTESLIFSTYGTNDKVYNSFINYGPWIGEVEQFSDNGFTDRSREMPLLSEYHEGSLQASWNMMPDVVWYGALSYAYRSGYYGRKSPHTIVYMNHHSHLMGYETRLQWNGVRQQHDLIVKYDEENLVNNRSTFRSLVNDAGASYYEYYDDVKTANRLWKHLNIEYTTYLEIENELPLWTLQAGMDRSQRKQTGYDYPFYRLQNLSRTEGFFHAERNIMLHKGILTLNLGVSYSKGKGKACVDDTFIEPSDKQSGFPQMEVFMYREYEYITAPQYSIWGGAKYAFRFPKTNLKTYVALDVTHVKANVHQEYLVGKDHTGVELAIGCEF